MDEITQTVSRKQSVFAPVLKGAMLVLAVIFLLAGVVLDRGFMLPCFLMALLYYIYRTLSRRDYEYLLKDRTFTVDRIFGNAMRRTAIVADLQELVVAAPHDDAAVDDWRRGGRKHAKKMDFTSYRDDIPYYTMIIRVDGETVKLLLDLNDELLERLKRQYPDRVIRSNR